jgi:vesicle coat complex subunit
MESMANCNYLKSAVYLLLLMKEHRRHMANSDMKNHINFKSLLKFFDVNINYSEVSYDDIVYKLIDKNIMTYENMALILPEAIEYVNDHGDSTYFKMTNVEPAEEVKKLMELNKQAQVVIPELIEEKPITDL